MNPQETAETPHLSELKIPQSSAYWMSSDSMVQEDI